MTQNNLANAYNDLQNQGRESSEYRTGDRILHCCINRSYTRDAFPEDWAMTQNNLANAYSERIRGEKAENIELAIASYTAALSVRTRDAFPEDWARRKIIWQKPTVTESGERKQRISNWRSHLTLLH
jgi:hypothetical protein